MTVLKPQPTKTLPHISQLLFQELAMMNPTGLNGHQTNVVFSHTSASMKPAPASSARRSILLGTSGSRSVVSSSVAAHWG